MAALSVRKGFAQTMRLIWIDARVEAAGFVRRADICAAFRISVPQASADLKAFRTRHPGSLAYDLNALPPRG